MLSASFRFPCGLTVPNRIAKASMTERLAGIDCKANHLLVRLYGTFAAGGAGLLLTGNVLVDSRYLEAPGNVAVEDETGRAELAAWAAAGRSRGGAIIMQINHAGRQAPRSVASESVAPSAVPLRMSRFFSTPREITEAEILDVIERFAFTAKQAWRAGFSGVEVHAAHGYLISQFLSPRVNRRSDAWGGSIENRARILICICKRIRQVVPASCAVGIKLNVEDFIKGGLSPEDSLDVIRLLAPLGLDFIELSGGTHEYAVAFDGERQGEALFQDHARRVREITDIPLVLTGRMRTRDGMERVLGLGVCDIIGMARPLAVESDLPARLLAGTAAGARPITLALPAPPRAALAELNWARVQLSLVAHGWSPRPGISPKLALIWMLVSDALYARRRRRQRKRG